MMQSSLRDGRQPYAIIIGLDSMQGIQAARILAGRGVPVIAIAEDPGHHCCRTKTCHEILFTNTGNEELIETLETLGPKLEQKAVLFPCEDTSVLLVSRHCQRLEEWYHVVLPTSDVVEMMMDKVRFYTYAQEEGFPIPRTFVLASRTDAEQATRQLPFPCILKPPHRSQGWAQHTKLKAFKPSSVGELLALYDRYKPWADVLIAQEWIEGTDANLYSCNCYFDAGSQPLVTFIARKLRQWPPETGQSSLGEECRDDVVLRETIRLFRRVQYRGLGYVEMKRDERSGKYFIMEPNIGRPTGRSAIAEAGGVELLYTMYCDALGWPLPPNLEQRYGGVKWIHMRRDLQSALHYWRQGELTLPEWWRSWRGRKAYALFSWRDPAPFVGDIQGAIRSALSSRERRKRDYRNPLSQRAKEVCT
jgi:D-aspartate ligase